MFKFFSNGGDEMTVAAESGNQPLFGFNHADDNDTRRFRVSYARPGLEGLARK
jgi:hypothetical protein